MECAATDHGDPDLPNRGRNADNKVSALHCAADLLARANVSGSQLEVHTHSTATQGNLATKEEK